MSQLLPNGKQQYFDNNGLPLVGGQLFTYATGTTTPLQTTSDEAGLVPNTNPIILNARGEATVFWSGNYDVTLEDSLGNLIWTVKGVDTQSSTFTLTQAGVALVLYPQTALELSLSITPSSYLLNPDLLDPRRYGAIGDGVTDDTTALQTWVKVVNATTNPTATWASSSTFLSGPLTTNVTSYVFTAALLAGAVSGVLTTAWTSPSGQYVVTFSDSEWRLGTFALNSTAVQWTVPLNSPATTALTVLMGAIAANNFTWNGGLVKVKGNSWGSSLVTHLAFTGTNTRLFGVTVNGNQAAFTAAPGGQLLGFFNAGITLTGVSVINSPSRGVMFEQASQGEIANCHFDNNANIGLYFEVCAYFKIANSTMNQNGYGWNVTPNISTVGNAFGGCLRYRSHHISFVGCEAMQNGRDGIDVNEGSYAIKFIGCLVWQNNDGGFTVAADGIGTGNAGDSLTAGAGLAESPRDLEYVDCEAYNNYSSGLALYVPVINVTVDGGRYYNNNRVAGVQSQASSYVNGIYVAAGSIGIRIRTKAYDDRQFCPITANASGGITATGWVPGSATEYPRVALYNPTASGGGLAFLGYGNIVSESTGAVNITPSAFNPVTLSAGNLVGCYVSQRVQHNGVFFDNSCQGQADVDGFGQLQGPVSLYMGFKTMSGVFANNQNVLLPAAPLDFTELLANPTWDVGTGSGTSWQYNLGASGGASNYFTTVGAYLRSVGCLQLIGGAAAVSLGQSVLIANGINWVSNGAWVDGSVWVYAVNPGDAAIALIWNTGTSNSTVTHPGGGWRQLRIGLYTPPGTTTLCLEVISAAGKTNYFDNATLRVRHETTDNRDYSYPTRSLAT